MYALSVQQTFFAQHFLIGGDWGSENQPHTHEYRWEVILTGPNLDQHGYLVDIVDVEAHMQKIVARFRDTCLNQHPEFADLNPSLERFAKILWQQLKQQLTLPHETCLRVKLWENATCWAGYSQAY
ncbi:MAG TPA: 6-carboxytetrahydropterin synthase [Marinagarivorans sp.]|nr:6-carboxytetrahydropterin synthase [Cellvibrionaceae bacterium]HMY41246.1 6-carboxytetrahydropterin synthase [Marinagarivorans sp.]HNG60259.1 6-carboxytetrahydropterin synthase [Cellvibrionaceae bacterium]